MVEPANLDFARSAQPPIYRPRSIGIPVVPLPARYEIRKAMKTGSQVRPPQFRTISISRRRIPISDRQAPMRRGSGPSLHPKAGQLSHFETAPEYLKTVFAKTL